MFGCPQGTRTCTVTQQTTHGPSAGSGSIRGPRGTESARNCPTQKIDPPLRRVAQEPCSYSEQLICTAGFGTIYPATFYPVTLYPANYFIRSHFIRLHFIRSHFIRPYTLSGHTLSGHTLSGHTLSGHTLSGKCNTLSGWCNSLSLGCKLTTPHPRLSGNGLLNLHSRGACVFMIIL